MLIQAWLDIGGVYGYRKLTLDMRENLARTTDQVTVTRPGLTMRGTGMQADFDRQQVSLLSQVRTHYVPHD